jgi:hypothetical protein
MRSLYHFKKVIVVGCFVSDISLSMSWVENLGQSMVRSLGKIVTLWNLPFTHRECEKNLTIYEITTCSCMSTQA